jgi:peptidoglycan/LPS O-acetylase OafA/YrhL
MLQLISKYKTELMGFAILWVILFHSGLKFPFIEPFTSLGYGGVDVFFFLSGYGLYFSSVKKDSVLSFYKKRFIRVFPTYAVVVLIAMLGLGVFTLKSYFINISTVGYWFNIGYFEWYIPSLFALYFCFPLMVKGIKTYPLLTLLAGMLVTALLVYIKMHFHLHALLGPFFARIPIFIIGTFFGKYTYEKIQPRWINSISLYIVAILSLTILLYVKYNHQGWLWYYGMYWYPFIGITPGLCLFIAYLLEKINSTRLLKMLSFLGALSLEIYLLHIKPFIKAAELSRYWQIPKPVIFVIIIAIAIPVSYYLSKGIGKLVAYLDGNKSAV